MFIRSINFSLYILVLNYVHLNSLWQLVPPMFCSVLCPLNVHLYPEGWTADGIWYFILYQCLNEVRTVGLQKTIAGVLR